LKNLKSESFRGTSLLRHIPPNLRKKAGTDKVEI